MPALRPTANSADRPAWRSTTRRRVRWWRAACGTLATAGWGGVGPAAAPRRRSPPHRVPGRDPGTGPSGGGGRGRWPVLVRKRDCRRGRSAGPRSPPHGDLRHERRSAAGVMVACGRAGLRVPHDISLCGFDDSWVAKSVWPYLTTVYQPIEEMGYVAASLLIDRGETGERQVMLGFHLVERICWPRHPERTGPARSLNRAGRSGPRSSPWPRRR
ncbi:substrate-binding domain-containing protein [Novosphingobium pokkalii]|uniref:substrate-binding domain-containing protein n=1 Tax=Novosphingobium pokkalii TaxID=1770194 RepID=UPI003644789F